MDEPNIDGPDNAVIPHFWPWLYVRVIVHWRSTVLGLCTAIAIAVPCFMSAGFTNRWIVLLGALAIAFAGALAKTK